MGPATITINLNSSWTNSKTDHFSNQDNCFSLFQIDFIVILHFKKLFCEERLILSKVISEKTIYLLEKRFFALITSN